MKVTVAIDSFKGSLSTFQAGEAAKEGIKRVFGDADVVVSPLADGGEGTVEAIISATGGKMQEVTVSDPLSRPVKSSYGIIPDRKTAVIEMSAAAGITLVSTEERNPLNTTTYGVGELISDAIKKGCRNFIIGIGGSATNDGGVGMLQALGFEFLDKNSVSIKKGAKGLETLYEIKSDKAEKLLSQCSFSVACDVKNVLCGENGCSRVYGPQKGADEAMIENMDKWLYNYGELTKKINPNADMNTQGAGAAGGLGFAFTAYLGGVLKSGVELVINETGLEEHIKNSDVVITGEGQLDGQSYMGKAPIGVASLAKKYNKKVFAFSGCVTDDARNCNAYGIDAFFPVLKAPCSLEDAMNIENAYKNLSDTTEQLFRILNLFY